MQVNPKGQENGNADGKISRAGSWFSAGRECCSIRNPYLPSFYDKHLGFRVVLSSVARKSESKV